MAAPFFVVTAYSKILETLVSQIKTTKRLIYAT